MEPVHQLVMWLNSKLYGSFWKKIPTINSTKSLTGHSLGAAGVQEAIYSLIMMEHNFIAASANIENLDPEAKGLPIAIDMQDNVKLDESYRIVLALVGPTPVWCFLDTRSKKLNLFTKS